MIFLNLSILRYVGEVEMRPFDDLLDRLPARIDILILSVSGDWRPTNMLANVDLAARFRYLNAELAKKKVLQHLEIV